MTHPKLAVRSHWIAGAAGLLATASTLAETSAPAPGALEEVVVTAQKRSESLQSVPQSISVVQGESMATRGVQQLEDLAASVPGISTLSAGGPGQMQVTIRGINSGLNISPTVSTYVDDVPFGSGTAYSTAATLGMELGAFDVSRVEVLRGPQGTLYGANAFGGLLKYVLNGPELNAVRGRVELEGSDTSGGRTNYGARGMLNWGTERFAARFDLVRNDDAGYVDNAFRGDQDQNAYTSTVARAAFAFQATDALSFRASVLSQDLDRDGSADVSYDVATAKPALGDLQQAQPVASPFTQQYKLYTLGMDYDAGFGTVSATVSRQNIDNDYVQDGSDFYPVLLSPFFPIDAVGIENRHSTDKTTAEVRLTSPTGQPFEWLTGVYYSKEDSLLFQHVAGYNDGVELPFDIGTVKGPSDYEEWAVYADGTYHFSDAIDATLGSRWTHNDQNYEQIGSGLLIGSNPGGSATDSVSTYMATVRYHISTDDMVYLRAASGYRPGGPNLIGSDPVTGEPIGNATFEADELWNYELGAKFRVGGIAAIDASVYYIDWSNIQLAAIRNGLGVFANGKDAKSQGAELSVILNPVDGLSLTGMFAYMDAKLVQAAPDVGGSAGETLPNTPKTSFALSADYSFPIGAWTGSAGATYKYTDDRKAGFDDATQFVQYDLPSFDAIDLRAGLSKDSWSFNLYARNVTDERGQLSAYTGFSALGGPARVSVIRPRTIGLLIGKQF